jgi:hypothetical protein
VNAPIQAEAAAIYQPSSWQAAFHSLPYDQVLGAGSAGPGKTTCLIWEPLGQIITEHNRATDPEHEHPIKMGESVGWALHLRRTLPMLDQTIAKSQIWFPKIDPGARWEASKFTWIFSSGYRYQFGHCADRDDWERYFSNEYTSLNWDELVQFLEVQFDQISGRLRTSDPVLQRMLKNRAMSNPMMRKSLGESFTVEDPQWVKRKFVDPAPLGKTVLRKTVRLMSGEEAHITRMYFPATLYDNPDPNFIRTYEIRLADLPEHIQAAMRFGSWEMTEGAFFAESWSPKHNVCDPFEVPRSWRIFRSMDWGFKTPGHVNSWALDEEDNMFGIRELAFEGKLVPEVARELREIEEHLGTWKDGRSMLSGPADTQLWELKGDRAKSKAQEFKELGFMWARADKRSRKRNAELVTQRLKDHRNGTTTAGLVLFSTCRYTIRIIPAMQIDTSPSAGGEEPLKMRGDHPYDSVSYACAYVSNGVSHVRSREEVDGDGFGGEDDEGDDGGYY